MLRQFLSIKSYNFYKIEEAKKKFFAFYFRKMNFLFLVLSFQIVLSSNTLTDNVQIDIHTFKVVHEYNSHLGCLQNNLDLLNTSTRISPLLPHEVRYGLHNKILFAYKIEYC